MIPGTNLHANVTGDCPHKHRTYKAAQNCIDRTNRAIKRGHGSNAYCDRDVVLITLDDNWCMTRTAVIGYEE